jgi:hypothetical protein
MSIRFISYYTSKAKAGYLWKKGNNMMKDWKRRWFFIQVTLPLVNTFIF